MASQYRVGNPLASHVLFPVYVAGLLWGRQAVIAWIGYFPA